MKKPLGVGGGEDRFHGKDWELERRGDRRRNVLHLADVTEEGSIIYVLHRPLSLLHPIEREEGRPSTCSVWRAKTYITLRSPDFVSLPLPSRVIDIHRFPLHARDSSTSFIMKRCLALLVAFLPIFMNFRGRYLSLF